MLVYEADARVWLAEESRRERRPVTLGSISASSLDAVAERGFRWLWLRGVWDTGYAARDAARRRAGWLEELREALPDLEIEDIDGLPLPVREYRVRREQGGDDALESLRSDLARRDVRLMLDFTASCVAPDHPWVAGHPELLARRAGGGGQPGGAGASPLDHRAPGLRAALERELEKVAALADGVCAVRCAGGKEAPPDDREFWRGAIPRIRAVHPRLAFVSEGGPGLAAAIVEDGFDHAIDDALAERLLSLDAAAVREHLGETERLLARRGPLAPGRADAGPIRLLERAGRPRAAASFDPQAYFAAAIIAYLSPGLRLFLDGQLSGRRAPQDPRLARRAREEPDREIEAFHERLLEVIGRPELAGTDANLRPIRPAWEGNESWRQFVALLHTGGGGGDGAARGAGGSGGASRAGSTGSAILVAANYGPLRAQCYVDLSPLEPRGRDWVFQDLFSLAVYARNGDDLAARGLYLDLAPWDYNVFEVRRTRDSPHFLLLAEASVQAFPRKSEREK